MYKKISRDIFRENHILENIFEGICPYFYDMKKLKNSMDVGDIMQVAIKDD